MKTATVKLSSISPYSQSRFFTEEHPRKDKETAKDHEDRCWMHRCHVNKDGQVYIPPMAFKNCLSEAAKFLGRQIPGKGKATYTKHFEAGVLVMDPLVLPLRFEDIQGEWLHVPSDGVRGSGKRVLKKFPVIQQWSGSVQFHVLDDNITPDVFESHLREAGNFIGIGRFRPRNNGFYGRFSVDRVDWS